MQRRSRWLILGAFLLSGAIVLGFASFEFEHYLFADPDVASLYQTLIANYGTLTIGTFVVAGVICLLLGLRRRNLLNLPSELKNEAKFAAKSLKTCPTCNSRQLYIEHSQAWYCFECQKYTNSIVIGSRIERSFPTSPFPANAQTYYPIEKKKPYKKIRAENQPEKPRQTADHPEPPLNKGITCPLNLDYFHKQPRPKNVPSECVGCASLIHCVCKTTV